MNIEILKTLMIEHCYRKKDGFYRNDWKKVTEDYNEIEGTSFTQDEIREAGSHYKIGDLMNNSIEEPVFENSGIRKETYSENKIEVIDMVRLDPNKTHTPEDILRAGGLDPEKHTLVKYQLSQAGVETVSGNMLNRYRATITAKPKTDDKTYVSEEAFLEDWLKRAKVETIIPEYKPKEEIGEYAFELMITDTHIGSSTSIESLIQKCDEAIEHVKNDPRYGRIVLVFGGDIIHFDTHSKTTTAGTQMESTQDAYEMFDLASDVVTEIIYRFAQLQITTDVIWVQGNHSRVLEYTVFKLAQERLRAIELLSWDIDKTLRKAFLHGNTLIGVYHGDMPKQNRFDWLPSEFRHLWSQAEYFEIHGGHYHNETTTTKGIVVHRTNTTIKPTDGYERKLGYINNREVITGYTITYDRGIKGITYF